MEPGWMSWRAGEMNGSVRSRLMAIGEMELEVVDSGVWQVDLAQPRVPAGVRPAYMSTDGILRALEAKGIWGLSGLEVAYRTGCKGMFPPWHRQVLCQMVRSKSSGCACSVLTRRCGPE